MKFSEADNKAAEVTAAPTPEQMFRLGAVGVCLGKDEGSFVESRKKAGAHIFLGKENEAIEVEDEEGMRFSIHKFTGRVARTDYRRWRMRIVESYTVRGIDEEGAQKAENIDWYQQFYTFEWTDKNVPVAVKKVRMKFGLEGEEETFGGIIFEPDLLHAESEIEKVSSGDCERMIIDIQAFQEELKQPLKYNR